MRSAFGFGGSRRLGRLDLRLRRRLLLVLLQGFRDRVDLRRLRLLLGLGLFLRLLLGNRLRRVGLLLDRLFLDLRLRRRRRLGDDRRLLSLILPTASSTGLASATFSTSGLGFSFLPVLMPAVTLASWSAEMMSTGSGLLGHRLERPGRKRDEAPPDHEDVQGNRGHKRLVDLDVHIALGPLLHFGDQRQALEPRPRQLPHHPGHGSVIGLLVRPHIYTLFHAAAGFRNRL